MGVVAVLVIGCVMAVIDPTPENAAWPTWYLLLSYFGFLVPTFLVAGYLLLDRRPLRREIPVLARLTVRRETAVGLVVILVLFVAWVVASAVAQA